MKSSIFTTLLAVAILQVTAQDWSLQTNVYDCRDAVFESGSLWVATSGGLCHYSADGMLLDVFTSEDEMDHTQALCIDVSAAGDKYIGTSRFVSAYDGNQFISIEPQAGIGFGILGVLSLRVDNNNILRFHTWDGISKYENGTVITSPLSYYFLSFGVGFSGDGMAYYVSNSGVINRFDGNGSTPLTNGHPASGEVVYYSGIYFDHANTPYVTAIAPYGQPSFTMHYDGSGWIRDMDLKPGVMTFDENNNFWIARNDSLIKYDQAHNILLSLKLNYNMSTWGQPVQVKKLLVENNNTWIFTNAGIMKYNGSTVDLLLPPVICPGKIKGIARENNGKIWVCSEYGITSRLNDVWTNYPNNETGMTGGAEFVVIDQNNNKWFGSYDKGIAVYNGSNWNFYNPENTPQIGTSWFTCASVANNNVKWFGSSNDGIYSFDGSNWMHYTTANGLPSDAIECIYASGNEIWCATQSGAAKFTAGSWNLINSAPSWSVFVDDLNQVWLGNDEYLQFFDGTNWNIISEYMISGLSFPVGFGDIQITSFDQASDGKIWIGYQFGSNGGGYFFYDGTSVYDPDPDNISYVDAPIVSVCAMSDNEVWLGALGCTIINPSGGSGSAQFENDGIDPVIYPNPAENFISFALPKNTTGDSYQIITSTGNIALQGNINLQHAKIDVSNLTPGFYLVRVHLKGKISTVKFVKK